MTAEPTHEFVYFGGDFMHVTGRKGRDVTACGKMIPEGALRGRTEIKASGTPAPFTCGRCARWVDLAEAT